MSGAIDVLDPEKPKRVVLLDGLLITGQQQYSGAAAARLIIEALGV